jgi:hypothetical protein
MFSHLFCTVGMHIISTLAPITSTARPIIVAGSATPWTCCGDPGLPPGVPVMHTIHDPRKTVVNPHNRVGISDYIIHYITSLKVLHRPLGRIQMPRRASSTDTLLNR